MSTNDQVRTDAPVKGDDVQAPAEGWQMEGSFTQRRWHYIRNHDALCGRFGFYFGDVGPGLQPGTPGSDCAECIKRVNREIEKNRIAALASESTA